MNQCPVECRLPSFHFCYILPSYIYYLTLNVYDDNGGKVWSIEPWPFKQKVHLLSQGKKYLRQLSHNTPLCFIQSLQNNSFQTKSISNLCSCLLAGSTSKRFWDTDMLQALLFWHFSVFTSDSNSSLKVLGIVMYVALMGRAIILLVSIATQNSPSDNLII